MLLRQMFKQQGYLLVLLDQRRCDVCVHTADGRGAVHPEHRRFSPLHRHNQHSTHLCAATCLLSVLLCTSCLQLQRKAGRSHLRVMCAVDTSGVGGSRTAVPHAGECATTRSSAVPHVRQVDSVTSRAMHVTSSR